MKTYLFGQWKPKFSIHLVKENQQKNLLKLEAVYKLIKTYRISVQRNYLQKVYAKISSEISLAILEAVLSTYQFSQNLIWKRIRFELLGNSNTSFKKFLEEQ